MNLTSSGSYVAVPVEHGKRARLIIYPGAGHGFTYRGAPRAACCNYDAEVTARAVKAVAEFMRTQRINP